MQGGKQEHSRRTGRRWRLACRSLALAAAIICALGVLPWKTTGVLPAAASPWLAVCVATARRSANWSAALALPALLLMLWRRRGFCRWGCPVGLLVERVGRMRARRRTPAGRLPPLGQWIALATLGAALAGYPLFAWLDPLAMLSATAGLPARPPSWAALVPALLLPVLLIVELVLSGFWCGRTCPLGGFQDLVAWPVSRLPVVRRTRTLPTAKPAASWTFTRRAFFGGSVGIVAGLLLTRRRAGGAVVLRPPGAADQSRFAGLCVRCGSCARACPSRLIYPDVSGASISALLAPVIRFDLADDYCPPNCTDCTHVCPSGALRRLSVKEKFRWKLGTAAVFLEHCYLQQQRECSVCLTECPYQAITIAYDEYDFSSYPVVDADLCTGCGACQVACPAEPQKAIVVRPLAAPS